MSRIAGQMVRHNNQGSTVRQPLTAAEHVQDCDISGDRVSSAGGLAGGFRKAAEHGRYWLAVFAALLLGASGSLAQATDFGLQPVATQSAQQMVTVTALAAGTISAINVLTAGAPNLDFKVGTGAGTCANGNAISFPGACTESVTFTPTVPGQRVGAVVLLDINNNVLGAAYLSGTGKGGLGVLAQGNLVDFAGDGGYAASPITTGIAATNAELYLPQGVAFDGAGNMYIADTLHERVRMVCASPTSATIALTGCTHAGYITTIAGNGPAETGSYSGDKGPASAAYLSSPSGVAVDGAGNLYIADSGNNVIRKIDAATGTIDTVAGNGTQGSSGNNVPAKSAELYSPQSLTIDSSGNIFIADTLNNIVRKVDFTVVPAIITTVAGTPSLNGAFSGDGGAATLAQLNGPYALAFDSAGNLYIADSLNNRIRMVSAATQKITTYAGTGSRAYGGDGVAAIATGLAVPRGVLVDPAGNVYIADTENGAIRKVIATTGLITTVANFGESLSGTVFKNVGLSKPNGLTQDGNGNIYIADSFSNTVQEVQGNLVGLDFTGGTAAPTPVRQGSQSTISVDQVVENDGTDTLNLTSLSFSAVPVYAILVATPAGTVACADPLSLSIDSQCHLSFKFAPPPPSSTDVPFKGNKTESSDYQVKDETEPTIPGSNSPLNIDIVGLMSSVNSTSVGLISNSPETPPGQAIDFQSAFGDSVTFTATVQTGAGTGNINGTITFLDNGVQLGTPVTLGPTSTSTTTNSSTAQATYITTLLAVGVHNITAAYNSTDTTHFASTSSAIQQTVIPALENTTVVLGAASPASPSLITDVVTFTATVSATGGTIPPDNTGIVTFLDGTTILGTPQAGAGGIATYTTTPGQLQQGNNTITAVYTPNAANASKFNPSKPSNAEIQDVVAPTTTVLSSSAPTSTFGDSVTFTVVVTPNPATAIPAGKVTLNFNDPTTPSQSLTLDATGSAKYTTATLHAGTYSNIVAIFPGSPSDPNNQGSVSAGIQQVVNQNGYTINWPTPTAIPYGTALSVTQLNATAPLADPTSGLKNAPGTFAYTLASGSPALGVIPSGGTQTLTATFTPTDVANFTTTANTAQVTLTVTPATPLLTLSPSNAVYYGTPIPFTATFSRYPTGTGVTLPTGTVTFYNNGTTVLGTSTIAPDGTASIITATPAALPVTTGTASNQITASWTDTTDTDYTKPITSAAITQVVNLIPTATSLTVETAPGSTQTILVAVVVGTAGPTVAAPQGTVFFVGTNGGVVSKFGPFTLDASGIATATPIGTGTYSFVAEYTSTDNIHGDSSSSSQTVTLAGGANDFGINTSSTVTLAAGQNSPGLTVTLQSLGTFTDTIGLGCASLPNGVNCHFTPSSVQLAAGGSSTAQLVIDTGSPLTGGAQSMNTRKASRGVSLAGLFLPVGVLFGLVFWRFRKRHALFTSLLLLLLAGTTMLVTSCGGLSTSKVAAGTYTIYVTGTGSATGVVHYQKVTLTIN